MFYNLFGCMHACILHVLSVCLTRDVSSSRKSVASFFLAVSIRSAGKKYNFKICLRINPVASLTCALNEWWVNSLTEKSCSLLSTSCSFPCLISVGRLELWCFVRCFWNHWSFNRPKKRWTKYLKYFFEVYVSVQAVLSFRNFSRLKNYNNGFLNDAVFLAKAWEDF